MKFILTWSLFGLMSTFLGATANADVPNPKLTPDPKFMIYRSDYPYPDPADRSRGTLSYRYDLTDRNGPNRPDFEFKIQVRVDSTTGDVILSKNTQEFNLGKPMFPGDGQRSHFLLQGQNFKLELTDSPSFPYPCLWDTGWVIKIPGVCQSHQMNARFVKPDGEEFTITCNETRKCPVLGGLGCPGLSSTNRKWQLITGECRG